MYGWETWTIGEAEKKNEGFRNVVLEKNEYKMDGQNCKSWKNRRKKNYAEVSEEEKKRQRHLVRLLSQY